MVPDPAGLEVPAPTGGPGFRQPDGVGITATPRADRLAAMASAPDQQAPAR